MNREELGLGHRGNDYQDNPKDVNNPRDPNNQENVDDQRIPPWCPYHSGKTSMRYGTATRR